MNGVKLFYKINSFSVLFKLIAPITLCICFLFYLSKHGNLNNANFEHTNIQWNQIFLAITTSGIIFSFNGFSQATLFAAESRNPQKAIPYAILGSILFTSIIYILIQYVFIISLPKNLLTHGWGLLKFAGDNGPFAGLAILFGLHSLLYFLYADSIISPLSTAFIYSGSAARMLYAFSKSHRIFNFLNRLNKNNIAVYSILTSSLLGFLAFIFLPSLKSMISIMVSAFILNYTLAPISLLSLRKSHPETKRAFKVPFAHVFCYCSLLFSEIMVFFSGFSALKNLLIIMGVSFIFGELIFLKSKDKNIKGSIWFIIQIIFLTLMNYLNDQKILSFSHILFVISIFCYIILMLATSNQKLKFFDLNPQPIQA